jgi:hypothetical protein
MPTVAGSQGELYIFGGLVKDDLSNDLYQFNTRELSAKLVQTGGERPVERVGHASAIVSSVLIVWGGDTKKDGKGNPGDKLDDGLYLLNLGELMVQRSMAPTHREAQSLESGLGSPYMAMGPLAGTAMRSRWLALASSCSEEEWTGSF